MRHLADGVEYKSVSLKINKIKMNEKIATQNK